MKNNCQQHLKKVNALHTKNQKSLTLLLIRVNCVFLQCMQTVASPSGTQTAACTSTAFLPPTKTTLINQGAEQIYTNIKLFAERKFSYMIRVYNFIP